jgi:hypothetical protein
MSKRNFILLIIILLITVTAVFVFLFSRQTPPSVVTTGINFISKYNPFGSGNTVIPGTGEEPIDISGYEPPIDTAVEKLRLTKISTMPIAGYTLFTKERLKEILPPAVNTNEGGQTDPLTTPPPEKTPISKNKKTSAPATEFALAVRYIEKAQGIIYQTFLDKIIEQKFSTPTIPKLYDAYFGNKGESVVVRHLKNDESTIETFVGTIPKEYLGGDTTKLNEIKGYFLPENIKDISLSLDNSKIFYLFENSIGNNIIGTILNLKDNKKVQIFDSPFTEWLSSWGGDKTITLNTKPSGNTPGYVYSINTDKKDFTKTFGDINGLTTLASPNAKLILYSNNALNLSVYDIGSRTVKSLGLNTLPEKCVWGKISDILYCSVPKNPNGGLYPDTWYQGEESFNDQIWKIDLNNGNTTLIIDPATVKNAEEIDGIKLALDEGENYLFFVNKKDSFLWKLDLK